MFSQEDLIASLTNLPFIFAQQIGDSDSDFVGGYSLGILKADFDPAVGLTDDHKGVILLGHTFTMDSAISQAAFFWNTQHLSDIGDDCFGIIVYRLDIPHIILVPSEPMGMFDQTTVAHLLIRSGTSASDPIKEIRSRSISQIMEPSNRYHQADRNWVANIDTDFNDLLFCMFSICPQMMKIESMLAEIRSEPSKRKELMPLVNILAYQVMKSWQAGLYESSKKIGLSSFWEDDSEGVNQ